MEGCVSKSSHELCQPYCFLPIFQNTGVAGPSRTPDREVRQALGAAAIFF
ncbi:hypothetical protein [Bradyrhizobium sp.]|nr:hypothetical protein [Bradyrhizobium sp.]